MAVVPSVKLAVATFVVAQLDVVSFVIHKDVALLELGAYLVVQFVRLLALVAYLVVQFVSLPLGAYLVVQFVSLLALGAYLVVQNVHSGAGKIPSGNLAAQLVVPFERFVAEQFVQFEDPEAALAVEKTDSCTAVDTEMLEQSGHAASLVVVLIEM